MATFKACVRRPRKDGFYQVYIRVTHHRSALFIKTDKMLTAKQITKNKEIKDPFVMQYCLTRILEYNKLLNTAETENWTVHEVVQFLESGTTDISFSQYARLHHSRMIDRGQKRNARNYELAYQNLERFAGTNNVMFSQLTSAFVQRWIESLLHTRRSKEQYPVCIRQIFKAAQAEINDYDNGILKIKTDPWKKIKIPKADPTEKKAITPEECRTFFSAPIPETNMKRPLAELGRDVAMITICLAGINTIDIFNLQKENLKNGIICYKRAKTSRTRTDQAYMEIRIPPVLNPLIQKYAAPARDPYLFNFHLRHTTSDSFNANVNIGIKQLCHALGIPKENAYTPYTFRHTWATIAQNDCGATIEQVAFGLNHSHGHEVTRGYIKIDFTPAWILNEKVVNLIFFTEKASHRLHKEQENNTFTRFSPRNLMYAACYYRGRKLGEIENIGFHNVNEIITSLTTFIPDDIPDRTILQFQIINKDKDQTAIYERMKGKSF